MDNEVTTPLIIAIGCFILIGLGFGFFAAMLRKDKITRNGAIGIRTKATMASDEAWIKGQRAGAPWVLAGALAAAAATLVGLIALFATGFQPSQVVNASVILPGFASVIAMLVLSGTAASRAAKQAG
ncbi:SdpI family protein [Marisediminicola senii]|uniref:SdpI family protein n=1 Tax=Marisediminicola senii TaxID=2711233 RepID=UPI0013EC4CAC|nr:SdpI family protein [Marisediminicola senii]